MKHLTKLFRATIAIAIMLCVALPTFAQDFEKGGIYYKITNSTNKTVAVTYKGSDYDSYSNEYTGAVSIPSSVTYNSTTYSVTSIGSEAFEDCTDLTSVTIPNSVTSIGGSAFYNCTGLTSVTIPNSVTTIGSNAFYNTPWYNNKPDGVVYINNVLYKYKGTMPVGTSIDIKEGTISISASAFYRCTRLTSVTIPNSLTTIGERAFFCCSGLTSVTIPNSVISIGDDAFSGCIGLTELIIADGKKFISGLSFPDSHIETLYLGRNTSDAFMKNKTSLKKLTIGNSVTSIGDWAFSGCSGLTSVTIGNSVTSIGYEAFYGCSGFTSVTIPNSVTSIGDRAFSGCSGLTSVTIPSSVTSIGGAAFYNCRGLTSVTIPNSVTSIGDRAFSGCRGLTSVTIPNSVTSIGEDAFEYCYDLETIVSLNPTPPTCASSNSFDSDNYSEATLYVPKDSYAKYFIDEVWGKFSNITKIETTATSISLNKSSLTLDKGATEVIKASITPSNTTLSFLYWTSDNPIVATVDQSGKITAISAGTAKITAMAIDGSNVSASCNVTVNAGETQIVLSQTEASLPVNDIMTLTYTITNSSNKTATWSTSNANVAAIRTNSDGSVVIAGISDGVATITATANDGSGASASCVVTVGVGGIEGVEMDNNAVEVARYDIHGRLLSEPTPGLNIVKMSNGTTRKEIVK